MTSHLVCDASAIVALLLDSGPDGQWSASVLTGTSLAAPTLLAFEAANIIRRHKAAHLITVDQAAQAHADLVALGIEQWPYEVLATRIWELRQNLTSYDAGYVALAEFLRVPLVTLDRRIGRAPGVRCTIITP
ncbi:MAG TPA: type II toxin-antitoxin system VapC family toxin [Microbacteriaceae bacterium]|nr:type II toxin-antitoxin system VapC family toxin [Microbacteriaceae bacterium]